MDAFSFCIIAIIHCSMHAQLMDSAQGDLGPKPKIEIHFLPKIAACRPCVNIKIPKELKELKFRTRLLSTK